MNVIQVTPEKRRTFFPILNNSLFKELSINLSLAFPGF